jgi:prevent-host-death family protein
MCYMSGIDSKPPRVGVRELRQNLSVYLDRVKAGETLEVTERGQPVAQLGPPPARPISIIEQMIAEGRIKPARYDHRRAKMPPPMPPDYKGPTATEILLRMREDERY